MPGALLTEFSGSPFQSSSRPVELIQPELYPTRHSSISTLKAPRPHASSRSKSKKRFLKSPQNRSQRSDKVPNAPRPSLQLSQDNILFAKSGHIPRSRVNSTSKVYNESSSILDAIEMSAINNQFLDPELMSPPSDGPATSTPFQSRNPKRPSKETLINSALVGAPRLALNLSIQSSSGNMNDSELSMHSGPVGPVVNLSTHLSCDDITPSSNESHLVNASPPIEPLAIPCVGAQVPPMSARPAEPSLTPFRCRICLDEGDGDENLFSPCRCKGTVGLVHRNCLEKWLFTSGKPNCELCGYAYIMVPSTKRSESQVVRRMSRLGEEYRNFQSWARSHHNRRHLIADLVCLGLLTPATYLGVYFCIVGATSYAEQTPLGWQVFGLWGLAILLLLLVTIWMILALRHHIANYRQYQAHRQALIVEEQERLAQLPSWRFSIQPRPRGSSVMLRTNSAQETLLMVQSQPRNRTLLSESTELSLDASTMARNTTLDPLAMSSSCTTSVGGITTNESAPVANHKIIVSVALSTVPEAIEEYSSPSANNPNSNQNGNQMNLV